MVVTRSSRSRVSNAAPAVSTLFVDAGCIGSPERCSQIWAPVLASVMRPVTLPRFGSATGAASAAVIPAAVGIPAESDTGTTAGLALAGGRAAGPCALLVLPPEVITAATATTTATSAITATASTTCVERRHRRGLITLLTGSGGWSLLCPTTL